MLKAKIRPLRTGNNWKKYLDKHEHFKNEWETLSASLLADIGAYQKVLGKMRVSELRSVMADQISATSDLKETPTIDNWTSAFVDLFDIKMGTFENAYRRYQNDRSIPVNIEQSGESGFQVTNSMLCEFMDYFYGSRGNTKKFERYAILVNGARIDTTIFTKKGDWDFTIKSSAVSMILKEDQDRGVSLVPAAAKDYAQKIALQLKYAGVTIYNERLFRLLSFDSFNSPTLFSEVDFVTYRFSSGLLEAELRDELAACRGNVVALLSNNGSVPLRRLLLPNVDAIDNFGERICCGGIGGVVAMRRSDDYWIPLQIRSQKVSDGRGLMAVIPKAFHQPIVGDGEEANVHHTFFRELAEELFGVKEAEHSSAAFAKDWFFKDHPPLQWFKRNDKWHCEIVAFGLNALGGNYDFGMLLCVDDPHYYEEFFGDATRNWEAEKTRVVGVSTMNNGEIERLLTEERWANESLFHFVQALLRLKEIDPDRVSLPAIDRACP